MKLIETSIIEDGWTAAIVIDEDNNIVDGFHRFTISSNTKSRLYKLFAGYVPTIVTKNKSRQDKMMSTIRHNRARGTHTVLNMAKIIQEMIDAKMCVEEIMSRLGMEKEEVQRLAQRVGIPKSDIISNAEWSKSWIPSEK